MLSTCYNESNTFEIGIDEAGRGPLFGRLYVAAAILPKGGDFHHDWMKDSKKFHSTRMHLFPRNLQYTSYTQPCEETHERCTVCTQPTSEHALDPIHGYHNVDIT